MSEIQKIEDRTPDLTAENIDKLIQLFPEVATEVRDSQTDEVKLAVDFDTLRDKLGDVAEGTRERYQFTWPGKHKARVEARTAIAKTLRPAKERSKDWDTTKNLYIEGDNLDALKILRESYAGKIKLIYIDPPYNTGHDFIYNDDFSKSNTDNRLESGDYNEEGDQLVANPESNGRFHSDWCSMMYPRLLLARDLLTDDGSIFISIDDGENRNLRNLCDEIFGAQNFVDTIIWQKRYSPQNAVQWFSENHDFILVYAKNKSLWYPNLLQRSTEMDSRYTNRDNDPRGPWKAVDSTAQAGHGTAAQFYTLHSPNGKTHTPPDGRCWLYTQPVMEKMIADNRIWFGTDGNNVPAVKRFLSEVKQGVACQTIWTYEEVGHSQEGKRELKSLFPEGIPFDTPKPVRLMQRILNVASEEDSLILDFFSGSASMGEAVMRTNAEDGGNRRYILVQLPETPKFSQALTDEGIQNLCDVGEERLRRSGAAITHGLSFSNQSVESLNDVPKIPDVGFRILHLDSTNYRSLYVNPGSYDQDQIAIAVDNLKSDRSSLDLLFETLPTFQLEYSSSIGTLNAPVFKGYTVFNVNDGQLLACFDENIPETLVHALAHRDPRPSYVVVAEKSLPDSAAKTNFAEIFRQSADSTNGQTQIRII